MTKNKKQNRREWYDRCISNLYDDEKDVIESVIKDLIKINLLKLLSVDVDVVINRHYDKYINNKEFTLQIAISKIHSTVSGDDVLLETYVDMSTDVYTFFKQVECIIDKDIYNLYITDDSLNIHNNFDKTFLRTLCYNYNYLKG